MMQKHNIEKKIEEALNSLDGIQPASIQPFFYTRLKARLEQTKGVWENVSSFLSRPLMLSGTICMVLLLNIAALYKNHISTTKVPVTEQLDLVPGDAFDVASNSNATLYNIWSQDNEQRNKQ
jgi:hypothetical protein